MLVTLIPFFDSEMAVKAYTISVQKRNSFLDPATINNSLLFDAVNIPGFEVIQSLDINTLSPDCEIFVPVTNVALFSDINEQCPADHNRIVILLDDTIEPTFDYVERILDLKEAGFKFAIKDLSVNDFEPYKPVLKLMDYCILDQKKILLAKAKIYFKAVYPKVKVIVSNIETLEFFEANKSDDIFKLYGGEFYRMPVTKGATEVSPLKLNYISLLNLVNADDFELTEAADIIGRDTALIISMLKMVNSVGNFSTEITSIRQAAAILGQKELKKWITTAITSQLCADRPSEIMRLSLLRAKLAENIAGEFELGVFGPELFLLGLFSVVDLILNTTMEEALSLLKVSKNIHKALVTNDGPFHDVLEYIELYEAGEWQEVSRLMLVNDISMDKVYEAYLNSLEWYRDLFKIMENEE